jgi:hypothetical protein
MQLHDATVYGRHDRFRWTSELKRDNNGIAGDRVQNRAVFA